MWCSRIIGIRSQQASFLTVYLVVSYFLFMNIVTERFKKRSLVNRQVLEEQLQAYREDGKHSARNLEEVRRLIK